MQHQYTLNHLINIYTMRITKTFFVLAAFALSTINSPGFAAGNTATDGNAHTVWVSPDGNDRGTGSQSDPFATVQHAVDYLRTVKRNGTAAKIILCEGVHRLDKTLWLGKADSNIVFEAAEGKKAVISGGTNVGGWTEAGHIDGLPEVAQGHVWVAESPDVPNYRQMWVNGTKMRRASSFDDNSTVALMKADKNALTLDIPTPAYKLSGKEGLEMFIIQDWATVMMRVKDMKAVDDYRTTVSFKEEAAIEFKRPWPILLASEESFNNHHFILVNDIGLLNRPQEWYHDISDGKLYYWPRYGETTSSIDAIVPHLETLVRINGDLSDRAANIKFRNVEFQHTTWLRPNEKGHVPLQAGQFLYDAWSEQTATASNVAWVGRPESAVSVSNASGVAFESCRFSHLGSTAVDFVSGVSDATVIGCTFSDIGGTAVMGGFFGDEEFEVHQPWIPEDMRLVVDGLTISNNYIIDVANDDWGCAGICTGWAANVNINHNELVDTPYSAISMGWGWIPLESVMHDNHIDANHIHGFAMELRDSGAIYTLSSQPNSTIIGNCIEGVGDPQHCPIMWDSRSQFDLYNDEGSDYFTVKNNYLERNIYSQNKNGSHNIWYSNGSNVSQSIRDAAGLEDDYKTIRDNVRKPVYAPVDTVLEPNAASRIDYIAQNEGFKLGSSLAVDLNGDDRLDIVYSGGESIQVQVGGVRINNGDYQFVATQAIPRLYMNNFAADDLDGDGNIDLVQAGWDFDKWKSYNAVLMNDGNGMLAHRKISTYKDTAPACGIADLNNDGLPDYFFVGNNSDNSFFFQKQDRTFATGKTVLTLPGGFNDPHMLCADWDNDGAIDIALLSTTTDGVYTRIYYNDGTGKFTPKDDCGIVDKGTRGGMACADINGDGLLDLAVAGTVVGEAWDTPASAGGKTVQVYLNNGDRTFSLVQEISEYMPDNTTHPVAFADWNNDGYSDLVVSGWNVSVDYIARTDVYLNDGTGHFTKIEAGLPGASESSIELADFGNRGIPDILINGNLNGGYHWHGYNCDRRLGVLCKNSETKTNTVPNAPAEYSAEVDGSTVILHWSAGSDDETPSKSLTYNFYVKDLATGRYLTAPCANVETGYRRVSRAGNAYLNTSWKLSNLPAGKYVWGVQTIDAAYAGSEFTPEQSFEIGGLSIRSANDDCGVKATYYSLQGIHLPDPPEKGIYIEKRGTKVSKIIK